MILTMTETRQSCEKYNLPHPWGEYRGEYWMNTQIFGLKCKQFFIVMCMPRPHIQSLEAQKETFHKGGPHAKNFNIKIQWKKIAEFGVVSGFLAGLMPG